MSRFIKYFSNEILLVSILALAVIFRFILYGSFSFSNDELSALIRANYPTFHDLVEKGFYVDGHPGGIQVLIFYWIKLFGNSAYSVRFPFVIMGILSVVFAYLLGKRWFNKATGMYLMSYIAFLQFPILFSQIARPYGPGLLFSLMMVYAWTMLLFPQKEAGTLKKITQLVGYSLTFALCMYTHYFSFLLGIILAAIGLFYLNKQNRYWFWGAILLASILFTPHIRITINHLSIKGVGEWLSKPGFDWLWNHIKYIFNDSTFILIITVFISGLTILLSRKNLKFSKFHLFALMLFFCPFIIGFTYSLLVNPVLQNSVLIFSFPFLILFLFSFANPGFNRINAVLLIILNLALVSDFLFISSYYSKQHFGEFKDVARTIDDWNKRLGIDNVNQVIVVNNPWYIHYYLDQYNFPGKFAQYDNKGGKDIIALRRILESSNTPYFIYAWTKPAPDEIEDIILHFYPYVIEGNDYQGLSKVSLYGKKCFTGLCDHPKPVYSVSFDYDQPDLSDIDPEMITNTKFTTPPNSLFLDKTFEYGPAFKCELGTVSNGDFNVIKIQCDALASADTCDAKLVASIDTKSGKNLMWTSSDFKYYIDNNKWGKVFLTIKIPNEIKNSDVLKIYTWNLGLEEVYIDNMKIRFYKQ
jgi:uncharacterized membrane protein